MENDRVQSKMTIVVENDRIKSIEKGYSIVPDTAVGIDLKQQFVMPGFMDMHVHIEHESNPNRYLNRFKDNEADIALDAVKYCTRTLMAGFTTVRDLGGRSRLYQNNRHWWCTQCS